MRKLLAALVFVGGLGCERQSSCVARGARVRVPKGTLPIEELNVGDEIVCVDPDSGTQVVTKISAIDGMEGDLITLSDLFVFEVTDTKPGGAIHGTLRSTGIRPKLAERLHDEGIDLPANLFDS